MEETMQEEPIMDVAHLGHLELLTPTPDASLRFFVDVLGMTESGRQGNSVYLRGWDDYELASLKLTGSHTSGLGHAGLPRWKPPARRWAGMTAIWATAPPSGFTTRTGICWRSIMKPNGTKRRKRCGHR
jgi:catechol 2,3-dioxygenase-like lactoylglutathione lyase family enzyme